MTPKDYKRYLIHLQKYEEDINEMNKIWDDYCFSRSKSNFQYGITDFIDDIVDGLTWSNIKKTLKSVIYYFR